MMMNPEISISDVLQAYKSYWWVVVVVFLVGGILGFFLSDVFLDELVVAEFSIPVVIREQNSPLWTEEDVDALLGFVDTWLSNEWETLSGNSFPEAKPIVLLDNETFRFLIEQDRQMFASETLEILAAQLTENFLDEFIQEPLGDTFTYIEGSACLTDASSEVMLECIPVTEAQAELMASSAMDLRDLLWVGERSAVQVRSHLFSNRLLRSLAGGICAEALLFMVALLDLTNRFVRGRE